MSAFNDLLSGNRFGNVRLLMLVITAGMAAEQPAAAYTDPGSGALILQMIAASLVGGLFYFRKILSFFRRSPKDRTK